MTHPNVAPDQSMSEPSPWLDIAAELRKIADDVETLVGEPAPACFSINIQPRNPDPFSQSTVKNRPKIVAAVDAIGLALVGKPSSDRCMGDGSYHRDARGYRGAIDISIYTSVADPDAVDPAEELARLRAENESLRAKLDKPAPCPAGCVRDAGHLGEHAPPPDPTGITYGRNADDAGPQVIGHRIEPHFEDGRNPAGGNHRPGCYALIGEHCTCPQEPATTPDRVGQKQVQPSGDPGRGAPFDEPVR